MPANNPQAYLGLLILVIPAAVYYFVVNRDIKKSFLYLVTFFGSLFVVKLITILFSINFATEIFNGVMLMSIINVIVATLLALFLLMDKLEIKNVAWLSGTVIVAQLIMSVITLSQALQSVGMGLF